MKINDCLKLIQKTSAIVILSAMFGIAGCGAVESDAGKAASVSSADVEHEGSVSEDTAHEGKGLSYLAYKTSEERQMQEAPHMRTHWLKTKEFHDEFPGACHPDIPAGEYFIGRLCENYSDLYGGRNVFPSNKFFKIEETAQDDITGFVKAKGTLYTVYFYDEPAYDLTYFPGDELPEGYRVEVTPDYEKYFIGNSTVQCMYCDLYPDGTVKYSPEYSNYYEDKIPCPVKEEDIDSIIDQIDSSVSPEEKEDIRNDLMFETGPCEKRQRIEIGAYGLLRDDPKNPGYYFIQYLTLEDLEKLPADAKLADDVVHY